jgi:hypothetical protein
VRHFNTPPHVWQLMAKHVDNNGRERPIIARNLWLYYHVKVYGLYFLSKDALRDEWCPWLIKFIRQGSLSNVGHFNTAPHFNMVSLAKHMFNNGRERPIIVKGTSSDTM